MFDQKNYWNRVAETKIFTTPLAAEAFERHVRQDAAILDVGCGYGRILDELNRRGYEKLRGVDFSEQLIARGKKLFPQLSFDVQKSNTLDFPDGSFDAVLLCAVLTCIADDRGQAFLRDEIRRVLRPGGILYVNDFLLNNDDRNRERYAAALAKHKTYGVFELPEGAILRHHDPGHMKNFLKPFREIEFREVAYSTMNGHTSNGFYFFGKKE